MARLKTTASVRPAPRRDALTVECLHRLDQAVETLTPALFASILDGLMGHVLQKTFQETQAH